MPDANTNNEDRAPPRICSSFDTFQDWYLTDHLLDSISSLGYRRYDVLSAWFYHKRLDYVIEKRKERDVHQKQRKQTHTRGSQGVSDPSRA